MTTLWNSLTPHGRRMMFPVLALSMVGILSGFLWLLHCAFCPSAPVRVDYLGPLDEWHDARFFRVPQSGALMRVAEPAASSGRLHWSVASGGRRVPMPGGGR